jgi:hypothetical protein
LDRNYLVCNNEGRAWVFGLERNFLSSWKICPRGGIPWKDGACLFLNYSSIEGKNKGWRRFYPCGELVGVKEIGVPGTIFFSTCPG